MKGIGQVVGREQVRRSVSKQVSEFGPLTSRTDGKATCSYVQVTIAVLVLVLSLLDVYCQLTTACSSYNVLFFMEMCFVDCSCTR